MDTATQKTETDVSPSKWQSLKERLSQKRFIPVSTYRLQFNKQFSFQDARAAVPYLSSLGVSHIYASPYFSAAPGSSHGYDVCDYTRINPELGSEMDYENFAEALSGQGMSHIMDFIPNHMGIGCAQNLWWHDVLENGLCSPYAEFFDIDWDPVKPELKGRILLPILGDQYGAVLERGELQLEMREGALVLRYYEHCLPINPRSAPIVYSRGLETLQKDLPEEDIHLREFLSVLTELKNLPHRLENDPERIRERNREKEVARERMNRLLQESPRIARHVRENMDAFNGEKGKPDSFNPLHELLEQQVYRLSYWRTASHEINYRRFFDINHLAGFRMEAPDAFNMAHSLALRLIGERKITGLRLDHVDGLLDPKGYFERLQEAALLELVRREEEASGEPPEKLPEAVRAWRQSERETDPNGIVSLPLYTVAEKILTGTESLQENWSVHGTTGYDFMNEVNGLFVDSGNERLFTKIYSRFTGNDAPFSEIAYESKKMILLTSMSSELNVLAHALNLISEEDRHSRDFTLNSLQEALREVVACFPIYRTYIDAVQLAPEDRESLGSAISRARQRNPAMEPTIFEFLRNTLLADSAENLPEETRRKCRDFTMRFQQFTSPVQAKGLEDTAFYRYNRFVSLNEVGGHPQRFGFSVTAFHDRNQKRQKRWPLALLATATHDHKRGEDARARLNVLSEMPGEWRKSIQRWSMLNRAKRALVYEEPAPDRNDEYLFYQTLLGIWPPKPLHEIDFNDLIARVAGYMNKAAREAKLHTSWVNPNEAYETAVGNFIERALTPSRTNRFLDSFLPFQERVARMGMFNSLSQVLLKSTSPGIPDFFQGTELWDLSLVDPDNRRPADFELRKQTLKDLEPLLNPSAPADAGGHAASLARLLDAWEDGRIKMFVAARVLRFRREFPNLFLQGEYVPLPTEGEKAEHAAAFARLHRGQVSITVVPRLIARLAGGEARPPLGKSVWGETRIVLPGSIPQTTPFVNLFDLAAAPLRTEGGQTWICLADVLSAFPVVLLSNAAADKQP